MSKATINYLAAASKSLKFKATVTRTGSPNCLSCQGKFLLIPLTHLPALTARTDAADSLRSSKMANYHSAGADCPGRMVIDCNQRNIIWLMLMIASLYG